MFYKILTALDGSMETPKPYGWFHLLCFAIVITLCILIIVFRKKFTPKAINIILLTTSIIFILFEVYKQLIMNFDDGKFTDWSWYIFPFQFCSTPMYVMLIASILKRGKAYNYLTAYLGTYGLFAGLAVMFIPTTVFIPTIGINIQTMVIHGGMVVIGVLLLSTNTISLKWNTLLHALYIFLILCTIAIIMNTIWHFIGTEDTFNMFFISPWYDCELPVLQNIQDGAPYIVFLLCYLIGFTLAAGLVLASAIICSKLSCGKDHTTNKSKIM